MGWLSAAALAKAKLTGMVALALAAGGVGGAVALQHVAPASHLVRDSAVVVAADGDDDPVASDPETTEAQDDQGDVEDPEPSDDGAAAGQQQDGESSTDAYELPACPSDVRNHGAAVAEVAHGAPKGQAAHRQDGNHGSWVRQAATGDCGKPSGADSEAGSDADTDADSGDEDQGGPPPTHKPHTNNGHAEQAHADHAHSGQAHSNGAHAHTSNGHASASVHGGH